MKRKWTRSEKILWLAPAMFIGFVGLIAYAPRFSRSFEASLENWGIPTQQLKQRSQCVSNLNQVSLAVLMYSQDYDENFPPATTRSIDFGWAGLLRPYLKSNHIFHCPKDRGLRSGAPTSVGYTNYYYNSRLSNVLQSNVNLPSVTVLFGEGTMSDARYSKTQLPPQWVNDPNSPARRHFEPSESQHGNANYAFADGHVNRLQPQSISSKATSNGNNAWTFSLR